MGAVFKKAFIVIMITGLIVTVGTACQNTVEWNANQAKPQVITYNLGSEPESLDPAYITGMNEGTVTMALMEGLTRINSNHQPEPAMAESWTISQDSRTFNFKIRANARWSNGEQVKAGDFEFAWKRLLDKKTNAQNAYLLYGLKNGKRYHQGSASAESVGVKALDDLNLTVELESPAPYFLSLVSLPNLYPVNQKVVSKGDDWWSKPHGLVGNGPFILDQWDRQQKMVLLPNPSYWDAAQVKMQQLNILLLKSSELGISRFKSGQLDIQEDITDWETPELLKTGTLRLEPDPSVNYYVLNCRQIPLSDVRVRKALAFAVNRRMLLDRVIQGGEKPALGLVPNGIPGLIPGSDYRESIGELFADGDLVQARLLLAEAGYPGGKAFPRLTLLVNKQEKYRAVAEAVKEMWNDGLGINVDLVSEDWPTYQEKMYHGRFQIAVTGWRPAYLDAMTFLELNQSQSENNISGWKKQSYDRLIEQARNSSDPKTRIEAMQSAEKVLMEDMPVVPIYYYSKASLYKPGIKGVFYPLIGGYQEFRWGYVD